MKNWIRRTSLVGLVPLFGLAGCTEASGDEALDMVTRTTLAASGASNPTVAIAPDGTATYVAWVVVDDEGSNVLFVRGDGEGGYSEPVQVNDIPGDAAPHAQAPAQVATGPSGEVYVTWQNRTDVPWLDFGASDVRLSRSTDGGRSWSPAITVNDNSSELPARNTFHDITVAADGTVYVSWIDARRRDGVRGERFRGELTDAEGAPEPGTEIRVARSDDAGLTFTPSTVLETNSCPCCRTSVVAGANGTVFTSWRKIFEGEIRDIAVARSSDEGRSFSEPVRVHEDGWEFPGCPHAGADLAVDTAGRLHVAWYTGAPEAAGAYYTVSNDGGQSFEEPVRLTPEGAVPTTQVALAPAEDGGVWVAWEDPEGPMAAIRLAKAGDGQILRSVDTGAPPGVLPALATGGTRVVMAWLNGESVEILEARDEL